MGGHLGDSSAEVEASREGFSVADEVDGGVSLCAVTSSESSSKVYKTESVRCTISLDRYI